MFKNIFTKVYSMLKHNSTANSEIGLSCNKFQFFSVGRLLSFVSLSLSIGLTIWVLWFCRYGFDFTDEGFYLNWISRPFNFAPSSTQFGFAYHPLYLLVDGSVSALRQTNLVVTYCLASLAAWGLLGRVFEINALNNINRFAIIAAVATTALTSTIFGGMWLPTPSYNTLAFQGLLVTAAGFSFANKTTDRVSVFGWVLIGVGGWLTFMGKPTSALALAVLAIIYISLSGKIRILQVIIAFGTALSLLGLTAIMIDGSIKGFVDRNIEGLRMGSILMGDMSIQKFIRLEELILGENTVRLMCVLGGSTFLAMWLTRLKFPKFADVGSLLAAIVIVLASIAAFKYIPLPSIPAQDRALLFFSIPAGVVLAGLSMLQFKYVKKSWSQLVLSLTFLAIPYAYAFGTNNPYWIPIGAAGAFVVYAGLSILPSLVGDEKSANMILVAGLPLQILVIFSFSSAFATPYRQPQPLDLNNSEIEVRSGGSRLILSEAHASYLSSVFDTVSLSGFKQGTPMIDLSGRSPGVLYAVGAESIGVAWTVGGYPGTAKFVTRGLQEVSCELLAAAWIFSEPKGVRPVPADVLASFGANLENDFKIVGAVRFPEGQIQYLSKPTRNVQEAIKACDAAKASAM